MSRKKTKSRRNREAIYLDFAAMHKELDVRPRKGEVTANDAFSYDGHRYTVVYICNGIAITTYDAAIHYKEVAELGNELAEETPYNEFSPKKKAKKSPIKCDGCGYHFDTRGYVRRGNSNLCPSCAE
jgi:hypothetical protein